MQLLGGNICNLFRVCDLHVVWQKIKIITARWLQGAPAVGKTALVRYLATVKGAKCKLLSISENTSLQDLFGSHLPDGNGRFRYQEGMVLSAIKSDVPCWLLLDELNLAPAEVLAALVPLLEGSETISVPGQLGAADTRVSPHLRVFATQNPSNGVHAGRNRLPPSLLRRFVRIGVPEYEEEEVSDIVLNEIA